ncbi:response regulator, partial [Synechocystis salina LEGE 06155]|nr:response regulator [Synechocystis salina LEGE 06155]
MNFLPTTASPTILIVDDQPSNLKILTKIIVSAGWQVRIAVAGQAAIAECRQQPPDLILLDVMLPDLNGFEVCRILKHLPTTQNIPILFMTALTNATDKVKGFQSGGVDYITKPFHSEEVLARLRVHWRIRQMEQILSLQNQQLQELNTQLKQQVSSRDNQLKVSQETLQRFLDNAHDLIQSISLSNGQFLFVNQAWLKILGYSFSDLKTLTIFDIIHPDYLSHYQTLFTQLKQGEITELNNLQICLMDKSGEWIYVEGNTKSYVGQDASITTWGIFRDITERHHIDAELRRSLREKESLLKEVHHRVKNNLLIVSSLMDWKCELINDPVCSTFFEDSQKRIQAMALIHEKLYRSHNLASINVGDYLLDLAQQ